MTANFNSIANGGGERGRSNGSYANDFKRPIDLTPPPMGKGTVEPNQRLWVPDRDVCRLMGRLRPNRATHASPRFSLNVIKASAVQMTPTQFEITRFQHSKPAYRKRPSAKVILFTIMVLTFLMGSVNMHTHMNKNTTGYDVILANTEESKNIHFNLRYQIYCIEKGYEEARKFPDEMEKDEYEDQSVHFLIRHRADNQWVGTFRLIIDKLHNLPIHHHAQITHNHRPHPEKTVVEFSRLAIIRPFQKIIRKPAGDTDDPDMCLVFNAISAGIEYSRQCEAQKIYFLCRPSLAKVIRKMGINCPQIGDKTLFRGQRFPYKFDLSDFPLHLFSTHHALQAFHRKNLYVHYCRASDLTDRHTGKAAAQVLPPVEEFVEYRQPTTPVVDFKKPRIHKVCLTKNCEHWQGEPCGSFGPT